MSPLPEAEIAVLTREEKEERIVQGNAGALDVLLNMREGLRREDYERWLDVLIREDAVGSNLYLRRSSIYYRLAAEACL